jgi:hypothetical protein
VLVSQANLQRCVEFVLAKKTGFGEIIVGQPVSNRIVGSQNVLKPRIDLVQGTKIANEFCYLHAHLFG